MATKNVQIFDNTQCATETFTAAGAVLTWHSGNVNSGNGSNPIFPLLLSGIQGNYARQTQEVYPVNVLQANVYKKLQFNGAPRGQLQCTSILSPNMCSIEDFLKAVGKSCGQNNVTFILKPYRTGKSDTESCDVKFGYQIDGLSLTSFAFNIQGNEVILINQPLSFTFTKLSLINMPTCKLGYA